MACKAYTAIEHGAHFLSILLKVIVFQRQNVELDRVILFGAFLYHQSLRALVLGRASVSHDIFRESFNQAG